MSVSTPCYYLCGPWYTWLPIIFLGVILLTLAAGVVYSLFARSE